MNATPGVRLKLDKVVVRVVRLPLRRPIVAKPGEFKNFPFILTDVHTKEGVVGHRYLEPYRATAMKSIVALIEDMAEQHGKPVAPFDRFEEARRSLHLLGRQGVTLIAIAALDMAMWDALAKALGSPLVVALGGTVGPVRSYNTNGLWLVPIERIAVEASALVAEVDFKALKIRLGRESVTDDLKAIAEVRQAGGDDILLMSDFNQGARGGLLHARPGTDRRRHRLAAIRGHRRRRKSADVDPSLSRIFRPSDARHGNRGLAGMAGLRRSVPGGAVRNPPERDPHPGQARRRHRMGRGRREKVRNLGLRSAGTKPPKRETRDHGPFSLKAAPASIR